MRRGAIIGAALGVAMLGALAGVVSGVGAPVAAAGRDSCGPDGIGVSRTMEIDTKGGPRFGANQYPGRPILNDKEVVLTFDDGPHKIFTPSILNVLDEHCVKATFFMVGQRALSYPQIVRDVAARGHSIATHTWTHQNLAKISPDAATTEIELGISGVQKALGRPAAPFFRFPYLSDPKEMTAHLRSRNTAIFSIDVDSHDFKTRSPTVMIRNVMRGLQAKGHGIILFHDIQPSTAGGIRTLLGELKAAGYKVVHLVPRQQQTTLADYDRRVDRDFGGRRLASVPLPVAQRGFVSPAWEVRVYSNANANGTAGAAAPRPANAPSPRRQQRDDDDWLGNIFRKW